MSAVVALKRLCQLIPREAGWPICRAADADRAKAPDLVEKVEPLLLAHNDQDTQLAQIQLLEQEKSRKASNDEGLRGF